MATPGAVPSFLPLDAKTYNDNVLPIVISNHITNILFGINLVQFYYVARLLIARRQPNKFVWAIWWILLIAGLTDTIAKDHYATVTSANAATVGLLAFAVPPTKSVLVYLAMDCVVILAVDVVYIRRILKMLPSMQLVNQSRAKTTKYITLIALTAVAICAVAQIPFNILIVRIATRPPADWFPDGTPILAGYLATAAAGDILLCFTFIYNIRSHKSDFSNTNSVIDYWIRLSLECMILPTSCQIGRWILAQVYPSRAYHFCLTYVISKLYTSAVLVLYAQVLKPDSPGGTSNHGQSNQNYSLTNGKSFGRSVTTSKLDPQHVHVTTTVLTNADTDLRPVHFQTYDDLEKKEYMERNGANYV
ncbi:hypothetical protein BT69DRAFT_1283449 [Atractiella rhizophila]|nr:hypothetical protein BT69DRAFT_1283449 [Atractiella rhizophila]